MFVMHKPTDKWPLAIKAGSVIVKIYRTVNRGRPMFTVSYHEAGGRKLRQFANLAEGRKEAKLIAERLNAGQGDALELNGTDRDAYLFAISKLKPLQVPLNVAIEEYVKARGFNVPIVEAAKSYSESHNAKLPDKTITEVFQEMLQAKRRDGASEAYLHDLKMRVGPFARDFKEQIANVQTGDIDEWLRKRDVSARSRNNHRRAIATLFNFAKRAGYLSRDRSTPAEHTAIAREKVEAISTFSAAEMSKLLGAADEVVLPWFALGAFCGLRTAEVQRLRWDDIRWADKVVEIRAAVAKTRRRRLAPLTPAAAAWLARWKGRNGPVLPPGLRIDEKMRGIAKRAGVEWKRNAMRHSFISFRMAELKDPVRVAFECGNSPGIVRQNYDAVATEAEGRLWFSIMPEFVANVIPMEARK